MAAGNPGRLTTFDEGGALEATEAAPIKRRRGRPPKALARVAHKNAPITSSEMAFLRAVVQGVEPRDAALQYLPGDEHQDGRAARPFLRQLLQRLADAAARPELQLPADTRKAVVAEIEALRKRATDPSHSPAPDAHGAASAQVVDFACDSEIQRAEIRISESPNSDIRTAPAPAPRAAPALPTLEAFASEFPEDMYSEAELMELYLERYPEAAGQPSAAALPPSLAVLLPAPALGAAQVLPISVKRKEGSPEVPAPPAPRHKLQVDARLAMLDQLAPLVAVAPGPDAPVPLWFGEKLGAALRTDHGVTTLAQLAAFINANGNRWYERVAGLGRARALRLVGWLAQHESAIGVALRARTLALVQPRGHADLARAHAQKHDSLALAGRARELAGAPDAALSYALVPLEEFFWPPALLGADGRFRGGAINTLDAHNDREAFIAWFQGTIKRRATATQEVTWRAIERLVLWALLERRCALSSLSATDLNAFVTFLYEPPAHWCSTERVLRVSKDWRPLRGPLDEQSVRQIVIVVRQLYAAWHAAGYLAINPAHGLLHRRARDAGEAAPPAPQPAQAMDVGRSFAEQDLQAMRCELEAMPDDEFRRRLRAILSLFLESGLRRAEVDRLTLGTPEPVRIANELTDVMKMRVVGKGNKVREIPLMRSTLAALEAHYADRLRLIEEGVLPAGYAAIAREDAPAIGILREGRKAYVAGPGLTPADAPRQPNLTGRLASGSIAIILKDFFARVAAREDMAERRELFLAASAQWLRHTFAHRVLAVREAALQALSLVKPAI